MKDLQNARRKRNEAMIGNMAEKGFHISMEELLEEAGGETVGRPHFANLMLKKGYVETFQEAFDKYLAKGMPLYMDKKRLDPEEAIRLIRAAGGIPVMAHPYQTKLKGKELEELVKKLKTFGLAGIEAYYSKHSPEQTRQYLQLAEKYDLLITAGSDFHGKNKKDIKMGLAVKEKDLKPFLEAAAQ
ncbi:MAG: PHP domain-containing protein [Candidatus Marinimicrobia bacterium]|nr:PHP domain-containing protein [Candidatus Neomarinimicrobiota bacterium]